MDAVFDDIIEYVEQQTEKKVFTMRMLKELEEGLEVIIVFEDKAVLQGEIELLEIDDKLAVRMKGNFI